MRTCRPRRGSWCLRHDRRLHRGDERLLVEPRRLRRVELLGVARFRLGIDLAGRRFRGAAAFFASAVGLGAWRPVWPSARPRPPSWRTAGRPWVRSASAVRPVAGKRRPAPAAGPRCPPPSSPAPRAPALQQHCLWDVQDVAVRRSPRRCDQTRHGTVPRQSLKAKQVAGRPRSADCSSVRRDPERPRRATRL